MPDSHDFRKRGTHFPKAELFETSSRGKQFFPFLFLLSYLPAILSFVSARLYAFSSTPPEEKLSLPKEDPRVVPTFPTDRYPNFSIPWRDTVNLGGEETPSGRRRNKRADYREPPLYLFFFGRGCNPISRREQILALDRVYVRVVRNFDKGEESARRVGRKRRRSLKKGNRKRRQTSVILVIFQRRRFS